MWTHNPNQPRRMTRKRKLFMGVKKWMLTSDSQQFLMLGKPSITKWAEGWPRSGLTLIFSYFFHVVPTCICFLKIAKSSTLAWTKLRNCSYHCTLDFATFHPSLKCFHFCFSFPPLAIFHCTLPAYLYPPSLPHTFLSLCPFFSSFSIYFYFFFFFISPLSLSLSLSQGLSRCHMTNGTTTSRPGYVMQWLSLPRRPPPWCWTGGRTPCWSRAASGHLTKRAPTQATPRKYWSESMLGGWAGTERYKY